MPEVCAVDVSKAMIEEGVAQARESGVHVDFIRAEMPYLPLHHQLIVWSMSDKVTIPIFANDAPNFKYSTMK